MLPPPRASLAEVVAGTNNYKYVTPSTFKNAGGGGGAGGSSGGSGAPGTAGTSDGQIYIDTDPASPTAGTIWFWSVTNNAWIKEL